jgi:hypothetical protein
MNKSTVLALSFFIFLTAVISAQKGSDLYTDEDVISFCDAVMDYLRLEDYEESFKLMHKVAVRQMKAAVTDLRYDTERQINQIKPEYGEIIGYKRLSVKNMENVLLECKYLLLFEYHALRWELLFYKPREEWVLDNIFWDDQLTLLY